MDNSKFDDQEDALYKTFDQLTVSKKLMCCFTQLPAAQKSFQLFTHFG